MPGTLKASKKQRWHKNYYMIYDQPISIHAKMVYVYLRGCADNETNESFPSYADMMKKCSIGKRNTISKALKELQAVGLLKKERRRRSDGGNTSNLYTIYESPNYDGDGLCDPPPSAEKDTGVCAEKDTAPSAEKGTAPSAEKGTGTRPTINQTHYEPDPSCQSVSLEPKKPTDGLTEASPKYESRYEKIIRNNIDYDDLVASGADKEFLDSIVAIMDDIMSTKDDGHIYIKGELKDIQTVKSYMMKLKSDHIEFVMDTFKSLSYRVIDKTNYLRSMLYSSLLEIEPHYINAVEADKKGNKKE